MRTLRRKAQRTLVAVAALALAAALTLGSGSASGAPAGDTVTLLVMDGETDSPVRVETYKMVDRLFEKKHPNVEINRVSKSFNDLSTTIKLLLSSNNAPDVVETNQGYPTMGTLVRGKLIVPLDPYARRFGWLKRQSKSLLDMGRFSSDGKRIAVGNLYGISVTGDAVGVFYNKAKLKKLGLKLPATFAEFEAALAAAKTGGDVPVMFGNLDKWPGIHEFQTVHNAIVPKSAVRSFIFGIGRQTFLTAGNRQAASKLQDWAKKGYLTSGFNGLGYDAAWKRFAKGEGLFLITGTWLNADLRKAMGKGVGFFLMPRSQKGQPPTSTAAGGLPWSIPTKSENRDLAAQYIDFITGREAAEIFVKRGDVAALGLPASRGPAGTSSADALAEWLSLKKNDNFIPFLDWATPTFYDTVTAALQELLGGKISAEEFAKKLESDYSKFIKSR